MILGTKSALIRRRHEYDDVHSFFFHPESTVDYRAGQHTHVHLGGVPSPRTIRELSFASAPHEPELQLTVHTGSGSTFKSRLHALQPGDRIGIFRNGGHITLPDHNDHRPRVLIAGGVGVVPFRSLILQSARDGVNDQHVVQVQRGDPDTFLFNRDFAAHAASYHKAQPDEMTRTVAAVASELPDAIFQLCGSRRLVTAAQTALADAGIDQRSCRTELWK